MRLAAATLLFAAGGAAAHAEGRVSFVVEPFTGSRRGRALDYLEAGLPAFVAERLAQHAPLRFVGSSGLFGRTPRDAAWSIGGAFERQSDGKLAVTVRIRKTNAGAEVAAQGMRAGSKDDAPRLAVLAALDAFAALPDVKIPVPPDKVTAPFGRDPYAFVWFGRAAAAFAGLRGHSRSPGRAIEFLQHAIVIDPKVPETRRILGQAHLEEGRPNHARMLWTSALELRPDYAAALAALAALDLRMGLPTATERFARLVAIDPDDWEARRSYGELLSAAGQLDRAEAELARVLQAAPDDMQSRRSMALVLASRQAGGELVTELETIVRMDPDAVEARLDLGAAQAGIGHFLEAEAEYREILFRQPKHQGALKLAASLAWRRGDLVKAAAYYDRLRRLLPQDPRPVFLLGTAHFEAGNFDLAKRWFTEGASFAGMVGEAYSNLGAVELKRGRAKEALWFLSRAAKKRPGRVSVRYNHALALHRLHRNADALNELHAAAVVDADDAAVRFLSGVVALRLGLLQEAVASFRQAVRIDPEHKDALHNLAVLDPIVDHSGETSLLPNTPEQ